MINEVAAAFAAAIESGRLDLPLPGGGRTWERWASLGGAGQGGSVTVRRHTPAPIPWPSRTRAAETGAALDLLGAAGIEVVRLRFPDTGLAACEEQLSAVLREQCAGFGVCLAPWKRTPMPTTRPPAVRRGGPGT